ncbi:MAG TPA: SDR family oxidoreductase [Chitinophagaceae bacterium]|nr:SDR family oxidoreductase [Chitinophagaceae bacterium]
MKILVTGASGYIGNKLTHVLAERGHHVHALVRSSASGHLFHHHNIRVFVGDILDPDSLAISMKDCRQVYHAAAFAKLWDKDRELFYKINVGGTENVLQAAKKEGVNKLVYTSSCGVWGPDEDHIYNENDPRIGSFDSDYDLSKHLAEKLVREYCYKGLFTVIVNPPRVFGPGLERYSNAINRFITQILNKNPVPLPWNLDTKANYAFIDDVIRGHILAMEKGLGGERYILGGENISYKKLVDTIVAYSGRKPVFIRIPSAMIQTWAWMEMAMAKLSRYEPTFTPKLAQRIQLSKMFDCSKAIRQLGYTITPFEEGIQTTIDHLKSKNYELRFQ